jgi:hypothetical protein
LVLEMSPEAFEALPLLGNGDWPAEA